MIMNYARKQYLRIAVFAALGAASGVVCAQSAEYRQGYEQGYRDGTEAQNHMDHREDHRDGAAGRIIIEEAKYGARDGGFCDPSEALRQVIGWRRHIDIKASNELCGDPAPHRPKHLEIRYRCGDRSSAHVETPESGVLSISCRD
ncbi:MAG: hypothetical protein ACHP7O_01055 [Burkholderiales bacterium]